MWIAADLESRLPRFRSAAALEVSLSSLGPLVLLFVLLGLFGHFDASRHDSRANRRRRVRPQRPLVRWDRR